MPEDLLCEKFKGKKEQFSKSKAFYFCYFSIFKLKNISKPSRKQSYFSHESFNS